MVDDSYVRTQMKRINNALLAVADDVSGPVRNTLFTQASLVATEIKSVAPVDPTSATPGALKASVRVQEVPPKGGKFVRIQIKAGDAQTKKEGAGGKKYDYSRAQEFGTVNEPAHPFFFPIWRARRKDVRAAVRKALKAAVKDTFK